MADKKTPKNPPTFICENCDFKSSNKKDYKRHLGTAKHKILTNIDNLHNDKWDCICGKKYKHRQSYHTHKKKCNYKTPEEIKEKQLIYFLEEQRKRDEDQRKRDEDQRQLLAEQQERLMIRDEEHKEQLEVLTDKISGMSLVTNNNTINNNNNTNNTFNLNFFLNTQCKDAIDFNSFLRSIKVDDEDIDRFENNGYLAGMMNVLERNL